MASLTLYLGDVAQVTGNNMNIITGTKLNIADAPTSAQNAANMGYVDLKVKQVQDALDLVTAGAGPSFDTLLELKTLADSVSSSGLTGLTSEQSSRIAADESLESRISGEIDAARAAESSLTTRVAAEEVTRGLADVSLTTRVAAEEVTRGLADVSLTTRLAAEEVARDVSDDRLETLSLKSSTTMLYVPQVYSDSSTWPTPLEQCGYDALTIAGGFDGWRMKNTVAGKKFNLYIPGNKLKVGDVKAMYLETCTPSVTSMPFLTIYTQPYKLKDANGNLILDANGQPQNDPTNGDFWYRSKATYVNNSTDVRVAGSKFNMVANLKNISNVSSSNFFTQHNMILTDNINSTKNYDLMIDTDEIFAFSIGSNSTSAVGNVECIIGKFKVQLDSGIHEFVFSNQHVFAAYMQRKNEELWNALYGTSASDKPFINDYKIPTPARFSS
jgi:hypothetical protein